tara:strand:- start:9848 stop:11317 length:1470 start_codon:yes stop_codon:yes gene_type:complete
MMELKNLNKYTKLGILVIAIAIILRIFLMSTSTISGDACWHFSASKFIADEGKFPLFEQIGRDEPFWPPPLFHIISSFSYSILGETGLKLVPLIFGSLALIFSYLIFRKFLSERASFYAILFMSFIPISIDYSILGYTDSILPFFMILSIYLALNNRFILSGVAVGLAILTKYNGVFVIPVLIYIAYRYSKKNLIWRNILFVVMIAGIISLPWFIRNWALLGNPVWPFLDFIFNGYSGSPRGTYSGLSLALFSSIYTYIQVYLGFFGVPDGAYWLLFFFDIPYIWPLITIFVIGTIIFMIPLFFGFKKDKDHRIFHIMLLSFLALFFLFEINVRPAASRIVLPAIFAAAFIYGVGMERILKKYPKFGKVLTMLILAVIAGFTFSEVVKFNLATGSWNFYKDDFNWVKSNTNEDEVFLLGSQCLPLRLDRKAVFPSLSIDTDEYDYVWVNQEFKLEPQSILSDENLKKLENKEMQLVYENKMTNTKIYKK